MKTALLCGYYGTRNVGDDLMLFCLQHWLKQQCIQATVLAEDAQQVHFSGRYASIQNYPLLGQWSIKQAWVEGKAPHILRQMSSSDLFIAGGGDILRDELGLRGFSYQVEKLIVAVLRGKPVYLVNVGITEPTTRYGRAILSWLLPRCSKILVRDHRSVQICSTYKAASVTQFLPDIVCSVSSIVPAPMLHDSHDYVLVCLHAKANIYGRYDLSPDRLSNMAAALDRFVDLHNVNVRFFACQSIPSVDDHEIHAAVVSKMRNRSRAVLHPWTSDPQAIAHLFSASRVVLAMRLHAGILAYAYQKPCIVLPYDFKVSEFASQTSIRMLMPDALSTPAVLDTALNEARPSMQRNSAAQAWSATAL